MSLETILYPEIAPFDSGRLKVSDLHEIYYEQAGNPHGAPVIFLHGGPGGGLSPVYRRFFDPKYYRIILFDQRGAGQSTPTAELRDNTTWDLVSDMEKLRDKFSLKKWMVFGGSWGSTLALAYAITHPERVSALVLRGIFLCRKSEIHWFYQEGASSIYPDEWERYLKVIPVGERGDLVKAYHKRLISVNESERLQAALAWSRWEAATSKLMISQASLNAFEDPILANAFARIECHYFMHDAFMPSQTHLLEQAELKLKNIPTTIVQGRYDVVCPATTAWELKTRIAHADFHIIQDAGHSATEPGIAQALVAATNKYRNL